MFICDIRFLIFLSSFGLQIRILLMMPALLGTSITFAKVMVENLVSVQYHPKLLKLLPLIVEQTPTAFLLKPAWANFVKNLLTFMLAGHVVGTVWYTFGLGVWQKSQN